MANKQAVKPARRGYRGRRGAVRQPGDPYDRPFSQPTMTTELVLKTGHAQRIAERLDEASKAITRIATILYGRTNQEPAKQADKLFASMIEKLTTDITEAANRAESVREDNGVADEPAYTAVLRRKVNAASPAVFQFIAALRAADKLFIAMDALWFAGLLDNKTRASQQYDYRQRFMRLINEVNKINARAVRRLERNDRPPIQHGQTTTATTNTPAMKVAVAAEA